MLKFNVIKYQRYSSEVCTNIYLFSSCDSREFPAPVVLVVDKVCDVLEVHEVGPDQHVAQGHEVAVVEVLDVDHAPRVSKKI